MPAPTFTNLTGSGASSATSFATASISPTGNRLILVTVHAYISTGAAQPAQPTVTGNGITYALVQAQDVDAAGTDRATMWVFRGMAAAPSAGAVTFDFGAVTMTRCQWSVDQSDANVDTTGTNGSGAIVQATGVTTASGATSGSVNYVSAMTAGNSGFSAWGHQVQEAKTPRASWTELADVTTVTLASVETQYIAGTDTAGSASWTTGSRAGGVTVEVKASAGTTAVGKDLALQWDVRTALGDPIQAIWDVRAAVSDSIQSLWDVRQSIGDPVALQWDARALATKSVQSLWDVRAAVGDPVQLVWDVQSALTAVGKDLGLQWNTRAAAGDTIQAMWDVRAAVSDTAQLVWDLRSVVADESVLRWDTRAAVAKTAQALWHTRSAIGDPLALLWNVESSVPLRDITVIANIRNNHVTGGVVLADLIAGLRSNHITGGVDVPRNLRTGSVEYVTAEVTFVGETAASIATATGQVQVTTTDTTPTAADPNWVNPDVTTRTGVTGGAKLSLSKLHTAGAAATYRLWAKVTDNPEVPILLCGSFDVRS